MKKYVILTAVLAASIIAIPAVPVGINASSGKSYVTEPVIEEYIFTDEDYSAEPYKVLDVTTGEVMEVSVRDYVVGAVCAEMPAAFNDEALKAQAVAAHTYAERQRLREQTNPTAELMGADFSNDTSKYQGYFILGQAKQYFGDSFEESYSKICAAVDEVLPYIITYNDEPIISAFHSMSSGRTESAENAWGAAVDYLVPVDSEQDETAPKYLEEVRFDKETLAAKLTAAFGDISLNGDVSDWIRVTSVSDSGTVLTAEVGDISVTGNDIRTALDLRSACFEVAVDDDELVITTRGFGHGVGMSQYGANSMAAEGSTWREILEHYYVGCEISLMEEEKADG